MLAWFGDSAYVPLAEIPADRNRETLADSPAGSKELIRKDNF
jgi:hypothetical protein